MQHFFQVDTEPFIEKNTGNWSQRVGWIVGEKTITPTWMTIAEASKSCRELIKCGCKTNCTRQCKCKKYQLRCTELCRCAGNCNNWISFLWFSFSNSGQSWIFSLKKRPVSLHKIYLAFKIFSFNLHVKERVKI